MRDLAWPELIEATAAASSRSVSSNELGEQIFGNGQQPNCHTQPTTACLALLLVPADVHAAVTSFGGLYSAVAR